MLRVTFRDLCPSEALLRVAEDWYRRMNALSAASSRPLSCEVVVSMLPGDASASVRFRARVEIASDTPTVLAEASSPEAALRKALAGSEVALPALSRLLSVVNN